MRILTVPTGTPSVVGDLGVVEVGDVAQDDRDTEVLGQLGERGVDRQPIGDRVDARRRVGIDDVGCDRASVDGRGASVGAPALAQLVEQAFVAIR